ncbi:MAG: hypothetical protein AAFN50_01050 [Pseudomonadota bacterium]
MKILRRMLLAGLCAPFAVIPAVFVAMLAVHIVDIVQIDFLAQHRVKEIVDSFEVAVVLAVYGVFFGWFLMPVIGFPAYALLRLGGLDQPAPAALVGATIGALVAVSFVDASEPMLLVVMTTCGASVAAVFCHVANVGAEAV